MVIIANNNFDVRIPCNFGKRSSTYTIKLKDVISKQEFVLENATDSYTLSHMDYYCFNISSLNLALGTYEYSVISNEFELVAVGVLAIVTDKSQLSVDVPTEFVEYDTFERGYIETQTIEIN